MLIRDYLCTSTFEQDATRTRTAPDALAVSHGFRIAARYVEHESSTQLDCPELFRLLDNCEIGNVLLVEQVDRLSRLCSGDWSKLQSQIEAREVQMVSPDVLTSSNLITPPDDFTARMFATVSGMIPDVLAALACEDYDDRWRRQAEASRL